MNPDLPYRPCVGIVLFNASGEVFVAERLDRPGAWQLPQGGIELGEAPENAALRELEEEIGTGQAEIMDHTTDWISYDLPEDLIGKVWKGKYCGQKQLWYAMRFTGKDEEINLETTHPEFCSWKWTTFVDIPENVVPFKRQVYETVVACFLHLSQ